MKIKPLRVYVREDFSKKVKIEYDKKGKGRPAWIYIEGLPKRTGLVDLKIDETIQRYVVYLTTRVPLFLPIDYTHEELKLYYDKFAGFYDGIVAQNNVSATEFLLKKISLPKKATILDLGAGTGLNSSVMVKQSYKNVTLVDHSKKMLDKAKKRLELVDCEFIHEDFRKLKLKKKFDMVISVFSLGLRSYFDENEMKPLWQIVHNHLKPNGLLVLIGNYYKPPSAIFRESKTGSYEIVEDCLIKWYVYKKVGGKK